MIPKIIHYCWFGGNPMPKMARKCIASWKRYCPDYKIVEWNETNFDINFCDYVCEAYEAKKWAFVSDVARLYALVNYGGIYMDTDVEVLKPLDDLFEYEAVSGFEAKDKIAAGLMTCCKEHPMFKEFLNEYSSIHFIKMNGEFDLTTIVTRITNICLKYGLQLNNQKQIVNGLTLFPTEYFYPKDCCTGALSLTSSTYAIHYYEGSWLPFSSKVKVKLKQFLGPKLTEWILSHKRKLERSVK